MEDSCDCETVAGPIFATVLASSLCKSLFALPVALAAQSQLVSPSPGVAKLAGGADRFNNVIKLWGLVYVEVGTRDSGDWR